MIINAQAITGNEPATLRATTPEAALIEFYHAFNNRDLALMARNWAHSEDVSMSNPLGGVKRGWEEIKTVYARLFNGPARVYVEFYDYSIHHSGVMFVAVGKERGSFQKGDTHIELAIRTSRTYRMDCGKWHQIHHHGSIDLPDLLAQYQSAVLGN